MKIADVNIGQSSPPYIIAEMSGNHQGSLDKALELLSKCAAAGADAFKLQTYSADSLTIDSNRSEYVVTDGPWKGRSLYDLYSQGQTPREWVAPLVQAGRDLGISVFSSPFSPDDVDFLENENMVYYYDNRPIGRYRYLCNAETMNGRRCRRRIKQGTTCNLH